MVEIFTQGDISAVLFSRRMIQRIREQKTQYRKICFLILPLPQNISLTEKTVFKIEFGMLNVSDAVGGKMSSATSHSQAINRLGYRGDRSKRKCIFSRSSCHRAVTSPHSFGSPEMGQASCLLPAFRR